MSKHETPMIREYWRQVGGTLVEEFPVVKRTATCSARWVDAIILPNADRRIARSEDVRLEGEDVIVVQAKAHRLGMYLMGQALFSRDLIQSFRPRSVRSIALCTADDSELRPMLEAHEGLEVVIIEAPPNAEGEG